MKMVRKCTNCGHQGEPKVIPAMGRITPVVTCPSCKKRTYVYRDLDSYRLKDGRK